MLKHRLCYSWLNSRKCDRQDVCGYAHGQEELSDRGVAFYGDQFKYSMNCRQFYDFERVKTGYQMCNYGEKCLFRHDHRTYKRIHRRHYGPHLLKYEFLFSISDAKARFVRKYRPETQRLQAFVEIEEKDSCYDEASTTSDDEISEDESVFCDFEKKVLGDTEEGAISPLETSKDTASEDEYQQFNYLDSNIGSNKLLTDTLFC